MNILSPDVIEVDQEGLDEIEALMKSINRLIIFDKRHRELDLLSRYLEAMAHLRTVLSMKNAQQEAQSLEEAEKYMGHLNEGVRMIVDEIADERTLASPVDLFRLFRVIAPEAAAKHPNHFRQTMVQFGPCMGAEPGQIPGLVDELFYVLQGIQHPVVKAIFLHHELVRIHPFMDGNGRVSRMAKNWILMYELYPPIFISTSSDKKVYIEKLQHSFLSLHQSEAEARTALKEFFDDELKRLKASARFIYNRMINNPAITFDDEQSGSAANTLLPPA
jgi:Fic family protein